MNLCHYNAPASQMSSFATARLTSTISFSYKLLMNFHQVGPNSNIKDINFFEFLVHVLSIQATIRDSESVNLLCGSQNGSVENSFYLLLNNT